MYLNKLARIALKLSKLNIMQLKNEIPYQAAFEHLSQLKWPILFYLWNSTVLMLLVNAVCVCVFFLSVQEWTTKYEQCLKRKRHFSP